MRSREELLDEAADELRPMPAKVRDLYDQLDAARERGADWREVAAIEEALSVHEA